MTKIKKFFFISKPDITLINKQDRNTSIIYRNYGSQTKYKDIKFLKNACKKKDIKFYLANNIKLANELGLDGAYIPSFNSSFKHLSYSLKPKFLIIGSAHTQKEIKLKELQKVKIIFISSLFKRNKNFLGVYRFRILKKLTKRKVVALGGISFKNEKKLKLLHCDSFAGISYFK